MSIDRNAILQILQTRGPLVPNEIKRALKADPIILGAILSEMKGRGSLALTQVKKGGSAFYYLPGQEERLEPLVEFLNPKDQVTVRRLRDEKVLNEANEELFTRVSFRNIPDFAKPFMIDTPQGQYRCWRYFLVSETEARQLLLPKKEEAPEQNSAAQNEEPLMQNVELPVQNEDMLVVREEFSEKSVPEKELKISEKTKVPILEKEEVQANLIITPSLEESDFYKKLIQYFSTNEINLHQEEQITKDREYSFVVTTPTAVGPLHMYVRARSKKKLNEGDAAPALLKAKTLDLPCLFLYDGEFTKKALKIMQKEYRGLILKKLK